jgi:predicted nucleotidyltransferase
MSGVTFLQTNDSLLYSDIEPNQQKEVIKNDMKWFEEKSEPTVYTSYKDADHFLPIGLNDKYAIGVHYKHDLNELKHKMQFLEKCQFVSAWKKQLYACEFKGKYDYFLQKFLANVNIDPTLKDAAEHLLRDEELLKFKNSLPEEKPEKQEQPTPKVTEKTKKTFMQVYENQPEANINIRDDPSDSHVRLLINRLGSSKTKGWKDTNLIFSCVDGITLFPSFYLYKNQLTVARYMHKDITIMKVEIYDLDNNYKKIFESFVYNVRGSPKCISNGRYLVVSDGFSANLFDLSKESQYKSFAIEEEIISAVNVNDRGDVLIGTYNGLYYRIGNNGMILFAYKDNNALCILGISVAAEKVLLSTSTGICLIEGQTTRAILHYNNEKPICGYVHGGKMLLFNKYGTIRIIPLFTKYIELMLPLPKEVDYDLNRTTPWYHGLYVNDVGSKIYALYPDGHIGIMTIIKKK